MLTCDKCGVKGNAKNIFEVLTNESKKPMMCVPCWSGGLITAPHPRPEPKPEEETDEWVTPNSGIVGECVHGGQDDGDGCDSCVEERRRENDNWESVY